MKKSGVAFSILVLSMVGCSTVPTPEPNRLENDILQAMSDVTFKEMDRCFNVNKRSPPGTKLLTTTYNVIKSGDRECSVSFFSLTRSGTIPIIGTSDNGEVTSARGEWTKNISSEMCLLKTLSCVRPEAAKKIANDYQVEIDPNPFVKKIRREEARPATSTPTPSSSPTPTSTPE